MVDNYDSCNLYITVFTCLHWKNIKQVILICIFFTTIIIFFSVKKMHYAPCQVCISFRKCSHLISVSGSLVYWVSRFLVFIIPTTNEATLHKWSFPASLCTDSRYGYGVSFPSASWYVCVWNKYPCSVKIWVSLAVHLPLVWLSQWSCHWRIVRAPASAFVLPLLVTSCLSSTPFPSRDSISVAITPATMSNVSSEIVRYELATW